MEKENKDENLVRTDDIPEEAKVLTPEEQEAADAKEKEDSEYLKPNWD